MRWFMIDLFLLCRLRPECPTPPVLDGEDRVPDARAIQPLSQYVLCAYRRESAMLHAEPACAAARRQTSLTSG